MTSNRTSVLASTLILTLAAGLGGCGDDSDTDGTGGAGTSTAEATGTSTGEGGSPGAGGAGDGGANACMVFCEKANALAEELGCNNRDGECDCDEPATTCVAEGDALALCFANQASTATCTCSEETGSAVCEDICTAEADAYLDCSDQIPEDCEAIDAAAEALGCDSDELGGVCYDLADDAVGLDCDLEHKAYAACMAEEIPTKCTCPEGGGTAECEPLCTDELESLADCVE